MKLRIEIDKNINENEVVIKCNELTTEVEAIQKLLSDMLTPKEKIVFFKNDTEYYIDMNEILFFETEDNTICAHTSCDIFTVKYKLYELEELLPGFFMRISKSAILNTNHIYSISHSLSSSRVEFQNSHKQVYVSRYYFKPLKIKLTEKRH